MPSPSPILKATSSPPICNAYFGHFTLCGLACLFSSWSTCSVDESIELKVDLLGSIQMISARGLVKRSSVSIRALCGAKWCITLVISAENSVGCLDDFCELRFPGAFLNELTASNIISTDDNVRAVSDHTNRWCWGIRLEQRRTSGTAAQRLCTMHRELASAFRRHWTSLSVRPLQYWV